MLQPPDPLLFPSDRHPPLSGFHQTKGKDLLSLSPCAADDPRGRRCSRNPYGDLLRCAADVRRRVHRMNALTSTVRLSFTRQVAARRSFAELRPLWPSQEVCGVEFEETFDAAMDVLGSMRFFGVLSAEQELVMPVSRLSFVASRTRLWRVEQHQHAFLCRQLDTAWERQHRLRRDMAAHMHRLQWREEEGAMNASIPCAETLPHLLAVPDGSGRDGCKGEWSGAASEESLRRMRVLYERFRRVTSMQRDELNAIAREMDATCNGVETQSHTYPQKEVHPDKAKKLGGCGSCRGGGCCTIM